ncbi:cytochrome C oxidase subunit I [Agriterribacter sp.]|uniref:cytochrome C oxidase subunit I n=1 Tax=Agriterribacter sp. TaxID=2821509 RepID=UPI002D154427|nr:cytochrome C oxidase subunit I [Agriterribacter sp.]HRP55362.1 cytochrome C oxidase subunit I [Agriterribacter sp.]
MSTDPVKTTSYKVVLPFYAYASLAFLAATLLLFFSAPAFGRHYFHPHVIAVTHTMALGWGTMIILGASHQLVPVLIEGKLYSNILAYISFVLAAVGIPLLVYAFYTFNMNWMARRGGELVIDAVVVYLINMGISMGKSKTENVHAVFVFTAGLWLLITTIVGLLLVYNFAIPLFSDDSVHYLSLHAHMGIIGWFLLLIIGVGSRLIPMFLISKYTNAKLLWLVYILINLGLIAFVFMFLYTAPAYCYLLPVTAVTAALLLFGYYCRQAYRQRLRKQVDEQLKISVLSVAMMALPVVLLVTMIISLWVAGENTRLVLAYGFTVFFGWITAIILGMTFKTLPFIVWNKVYHKKAGLGKTPNPKNLFSSKVFTGMAVLYLLGFVLFTAGILLSVVFVLQAGAVLLLAAAGLYNFNVFKAILHKPAIS